MPKYKYTGCITAFSEDGDNQLIVPTNTNTNSETVINRDDNSYSQRLLMRELLEQDDNHQATAPTAVNDEKIGGYEDVSIPPETTITIPSPVTVSVLDNDIENGMTIDISSIEIIGGTENGKVLQVNNGKWRVNDGSQIDRPLGTVTYEPSGTLGENPAPITYTVADNAGNRSNQATITITHPVALP